MKNSRLAITAAAVAIMAGAGSVASAQYGSYGVPAWRVRARMLAQARRRAALAKRYGYPAYPSAANQASAQAAAAAKAGAAAKAAATAKAKAAAQQAPASVPAAAALAHGTVLAAPSPAAPAHTVPAHIATAAPAGHTAPATAAATSAAATVPQDVEARPVTSFSETHTTQTAGPTEISGATLRTLGLNLGAVVALVCGSGAAWKRWKGGKPVRFGNSAEGLKLHSSVALGPQRFVHVVAVGERQFLLGSSAQHVTLIADLSEARAAQPEPASEPEAAPEADRFEQILARLSTQDAERNSAPAPKPLLRIEKEQEEPLREAPAPARTGRMFSRSEAEPVAHTSRSVADEDAAALNDGRGRTPVERYRAVSSNAYGAPDHDPGIRLGAEAGPQQMSAVSATAVRPAPAATGRLFQRSGN